MVKCAGETIILRVQYSCKLITLAKELPPRNSRACVRKFDLQSLVGFSVRLTQYDVIPDRVTKPGGFEIGLVFK
jgi:hypothetical protein